MKGVVIGGTRSGVGKTVATLAVIRALDTAGYTVQPAKAGPDFIDPSHHEAVAGRPSRTLDSWLQGEDGLRRNYYRGAGDICVVEGMMGVYDGDVSSTAKIADALDVPVVLVVDASAGMESIAATALGFKRYAERVGPDIDVTGIIAQRAHGGHHERGIREALPEGLVYLGRIPPRDDLEIPERHLGLQLGEEATPGEEALAAAAEHIRADRLVDLARSPAKPPGPIPGADTDHRIAVARDRAFCFCYPSTVDRLHDRADVVTFAPVAGDDLPDCDGVYLPGGYPECHASALATAPALSDIADRASEGLPILGECGGFMALSKSLTTATGQTEEMAGVLPVDVRMHECYQALNHVELRARTGTLTADLGSILRGHEFHYSSATTDDDARFAFDVDRGEGIAGEGEGLVEYRTLGTYCHVHPESGAFDTFVDSVGDS